MKGNKILENDSWVWVSMIKRKYALVRNNVPWNCDVGAMYQNGNRVHDLNYSMAKVLNNTTWNIILHQECVKFYLLPSNSSSEHIKQRLIKIS